MNYSHVKLGKFMQCFAVHGDRMYVRGHNRWNDSRQGDGIEPEDLKPLSSDMRDTFHDRFGIDEKEVARIFAD